MHPALDLFHFNQTASCKGYDASTLAKELFVVEEHTVRPGFIAKSGDQIFDSLVLRFF